MQIKYSPVRSDKTIEYTFENDIIHVQTGEDTDTFDFSSFGDGEANVSEFVTTLPVNPIVSAKRVDGELFVELLNYISANATHEERFPQWEVM